MRAHTAALAAALLVILALSAAPASAHTVSGSGATNFRTTLDAFTPAVPGLRLAVVENGSRLLLVNGTSTPVVVLGYDGEPYLRVGPEGVFENERSPAAYLNRTLTGTGPVPGTADTTAAPRWRQVSIGHTALWHDHQTHWMGSADPPQVAAAPARFHHVFDWTLGFRHGDRPVTAAGRLDWVPGPSPLRWLALSAVLGLSAVAAAIPRRAWGPGLAVATAALVAVDVAHSAGVALAVAGDPTDRWRAFLFGNVVQLALWTGGLVVAALLTRRRVGGLWAAGIVGVCLGVADGLADAAVLWRSSAPFGWPLWVARTTTAGTVGLGLGLLVAAALAVRRHDPLPRRAGIPGRRTGTEGEDRRSDS